MQSEVFRMKTNLVALVLMLMATATLAAEVAQPDTVKPVAAAQSPENAGNLYTATDGPYSITVHKSLVLHDEHRNKDLAVRITFPDQGRNLPVIVWSHGAMGSKDIYTRLISYWASHGYVCIQPDHSDSINFGKKTDKREIFGDWASRPADITFVIDSLNSIGQMIEALKGRMDTSSIGVGGHSFGAHTAQLVAGAAVRKSQAATYASYSDPRPRAFVLLSPQGTGDRESMMDTGSWQNMKRPVLTVTGSNDPGRTGKGWQWRLEPFLYAPPQDKYLLFIQGAYHGFGGIVGSGFATTGPDDEADVRYVNAVTTAFWDAYLKSDSRALTFLRDGSVARLTHSRAEVIVRGVNDERIDELGKTAADSGGAGLAGNQITAAQVISRFDRDGDSKLARDEMPPRLAPAFNRIDTDGSGYVSADELTPVLQIKRQ
jgi:predicted dienelactone hydrolase